MNADEQTPEELAHWAEVRIHQLSERVAYLAEVARVHRQASGDWAYHVTDAASDIRRTAYEMEYLVSSFALSEDLVGATDISKAAKVTPASMYHRLTTKLAKKLMTSVFGSARQLRLPEVS